MREKESNSAVSPVVGVVLMIAVAVVISIIVFQLGLDLDDVVSTTNPDAAVTVEETLNTSYNGSGKYYDVLFTYSREINSDKVLIRDADVGSGANLTRTGSTATLLKEEGATMVVIAVKNGERRVLYTYEVGD